jgi:hypothetical protein
MHRSSFRIAALRFMITLGLLCSSGFGIFGPSAANAQSLNASPFNLALNRPVTADSSASSTYAPEKAVDGETFISTSQWRSASTSSAHWLAVDLGGTYNVSRVLLWTPSAISSYRFEYWNGSAWQAVGSTTSSNYALKSGFRLTFNDFPAVSTDKIRIYSTSGAQLQIVEMEVFSSKPQPVYANQTGYNLGYPKRFTAPNANNGDSFSIYKVGASSPSYTGTISNKIGDFTAFEPSDIGDYVILVSGSAGIGQSLPFAIAPNWIERVSYESSLAFLVDSRCWNGNSTARSGSSAGCSSGVAWRDSHQFSFEMQAIWTQLAANPSAYQNMDLGGTYIYPGASLPANTPEIVKLFYWPVAVYMQEYNGGRVNHTLLKEQLAYFLYAYPDLQEYIPLSVYEEVRDYLFSVWGNSDRSRWNWYDVGHTANLFQTYTVIGDGKGAFPPGHSIMPNLMMYEVAKREGRSDASLYFDAAYNNTAWLIANLDWNNPSTTKGQRMSEHITMEALAYFLKEYPSSAPTGLAAKIEAWAEVMISRSNNLWDFRKYSDSLWIIPSYNEIGNVVGFPAAAFAAIQVLEDEDLKTELRRIAIAQIDGAFGRNPTGRSYSHDAATPDGFEGVEFGWYDEYRGGLGDLNNVRGVWDGSPKEASFPYNPNADPAYSEGWVAFNTAWNSTLGYLAADSTDIKLYNSSFSSPLSSIGTSGTIGVELQAPLNLDYTSVETATVQIRSGSGDSINLVLSETSANGNRFRGTFSVGTGTVNPSDAVLQVGSNDQISASYGYGTFKKTAQATVGSGYSLAAPILYSPAPGDGQISLSWSNVNGASNYTVFYGPVGGSYSNSYAAGSATSATITGLSNGQNYSFIVRASNGSTQSPSSNERRSAPQDILVAPSQFEPVAGPNKVTLTWTPVAGASSYTVRYGTSAGVYPNTLVAGNTTSAIVDGLTNGTTYYFVVQGARSSGEGPISAAKSATPAPLPQTIYSDNFDDGDSVGWTVTNGSWSVNSSNKLQQSSNATSEALILSSATPPANYTVEADITLLNKLDNQSATGLVARYVDNNNYYLLRLHGSNQLELYRKLSGTFSKLASTSFTPVVNQNYRLGFEVNGSNLTAYVDGVRYFSHTDTNHASGGIGVRSYWQSATVDNVVIRAAMTPLLSDNFSDGDSAGWSILSGSWSVNNNQFEQSSSAASEGLIINGNSGWQNYQVSADVTMLTLPHYSAATGIIARYVDSNNYYLLRLHGNNLLELYKKAGGTFSLLTSAAYPVSTNTTYRLSLSVQGSTLIAAVNGAALISYTDSTHTAGRIGVRSYYQSASIDNVEVIHNIPTPSFTSSVSGTTVSFTNTSSPGSQPIVGYRWNFGDGSSIVTTQHASHSYASSGIYQVRLTVIDSNGIEATVPQVVIIP